MVGSLLWERMVVLRDSFEVWVSILPVYIRLREGIRGGQRLLTLTFCI